MGPVFHWYYHGFLLRNLPKIASDGLVPRPFVWLATDFQTAALWAERRSGRWTDSGQHITDPYTILRVQLNEQVVRPDPNLPGDLTSVTVDFRISPRNLKRLYGDVWVTPKKWVSIWKLDAVYLAAIKEAATSNRR